MSGWHSQRLPPLRTRERLCPTWPGPLEFSCLTFYKLFAWLESILSTETLTGVGCWPTGDFGSFSWAASMFFGCVSEDCNGSSWCLTQMFPFPCSKSMGRMVHEGDQGSTWWTAVGNCWVLHWWPIPKSSSHPVGVFDTTCVWWKADPFPLQAQGSQTFSLLPPGSWFWAQNIGQVNWKLLPGALNQQCTCAGSPCRDHYWQSQWGQEAWWRKQWREKVMAAMSLRDETFIPLYDSGSTLDS